MGRTFLDARNARLRTSSRMATLVQSPSPEAIADGSHDRHPAVKACTVMGSSKPLIWPSMQPQEYAAAESMLQHSRSARSNHHLLHGYHASVAEPRDLSNDAVKTRTLLHSGQDFQMPAYAQLRQPFQPTGTPSDIRDGRSISLQDIQNPMKHQTSQTYDNDPCAHSSRVPRETHRSTNFNEEKGRRSMEYAQRKSPPSVRGLDPNRSDALDHHSGDEDPTQLSIKEESESQPLWLAQKTKAGKDRKRLPLACIACRRKKIRCSGEKPACKNCMRSRMPCVYKTSSRKAAPRTDYMAMLERRLKRMEERVIKIIPKEDIVDVPAIPRANVRPPPGGRSHNGRKRDAEEAFGAQINEWARSTLDSEPLKGLKAEESKANTEGAEHLPPKEIQEHLSEVFFDWLYGQTYHLMHKPSYMRRLRFVFWVFR